MDRVKLGRALGYGTRHAAKTLAAVAEAATATPPPQQGRNPSRAEQAASSASEASGMPAARRAQQAVPRVGAAQVRGAGRSVWAPLATFSGALWLRVTGCFFALVAFTMASGAWRQRGALQAGADPLIVRHFWIFAGVAVVFGYFAVSSFVRADRRERRAAARRVR